MYIDLLLKGLPLNLLARKRIKRRNGSQLFDVAWIGHFQSFLLNIA